MAHLDQSGAQPADRADAGALPSGAQQGVAVFFITGRPESLRKPTERNLRAAGYDGWSALVMVPGNFPRLKSAADYKAPARKRIAEQGYTIVLNMGDQESDLAGGYAERTFKLPDPFYYVP
jgi:predicted secreted acid phosphatase